MTCSRQNNGLGVSCRCIREIFTRRWRSMSCFCSDGKVFICNQVKNDRWYNLLIQENVKYNTKYSSFYNQDLTKGKTKRVLLKKPTLLHQISFYFFLNFDKNLWEFWKKVIQILLSLLKINLINWAQKKLKTRCFPFIQLNLLWLNLLTSHSTNKDKK